MKEETTPGVVMSLTNSPTKRQQVVNEITEKIRRGILEPGARLATVRDMSAHFDVSLSVIQNAMRELMDNGFVECRGASGFYVRTNLSRDEKINKMSQFQKYWLSRVNHLFFRASKPFRRTNPDFFTKNGKKSNFGPFSSSPVNAGCSRYPVVYVSLISSIQAC